MKPVPCGQPPFFKMQTSIAVHATKSLSIGCRPAIASRPVFIMSVPDHTPSHGPVLAGGERAGRAGTLLLFDHGL